MKTKKIFVEFEEVRIVDFMIDLDNLDNYMSKFLALKNHQRHTPEILEVRGFDESNHVRVVILLDEEEDEKKQVEQAKDFVEQFGDILQMDVDNSWILNDSYFDGVHSHFNTLDWFVYDKH